MKKLIITMLTITFIITGCGENKNSISTNKTKDDVKSVVSSETVENENQNETKVEEKKDEEKNEIRVKKEDINTPVVIEGMMVGGLVKGNWMSFREFVNLNKDKFNGVKYDLYKDRKKIVTSSDVVEGNDYTSVEFTKDGKKIENIPDVAINAKWDLYPRQPKIQNPNQKEYIDVVNKVLKDNGVDKPNVKIKEIMRVDLDGDGTEEVLISASSFESPAALTDKGDYSLVLIRKIVNGKVETKVIEKYINTDGKTKDEFGNESAFMQCNSTFDIYQVADLDGDGNLEVIIDSHSWEYWGCEIYKLNNNELKLVAENGWGV